MDLWVSSGGLGPKIARFGLKCM